MAEAYCQVATPWGWLGLLKSPGGLERLALPQPSPEAILNLLAPIEAREDPGAFGDLPQRLQRYFQGKAVAFPDPLDLEGASPFQKTVWTAARTVGYGQARTYGWLALQIGKPGAARAVGQALSANPLPIIVPCHRILARDGGLGGWFGGNIEEKARLLKLEGLNRSVRLPNRPGDRRQRRADPPP